MEKAAAAVRVKSKFLKFLPRAASDVTLQRPPYSPTKRISDTGAKPGKAFSGPIIPLVPAEARRKPKNSSFETREPSSPKISCMGQIKIKHKNKQNKIEKKEKQHVSLPRDFKPVVHSDRPAKKKASAIGKLFGGARSQGRKSNASDHGRSKPPRVPAAGRPAPGLNQMKRFASGREHALSSFDWTAQVAPVDRDQGDYFSDEEGEGEEEREVIIPFSAPIMRGGGGGSRGGGGRGGEVVGLEPKKEINLWKRRTMAQPRPLQVN